MSETQSKTIAFRLNHETYFRLEAFAAEKGLSVGKYLKKRLEDDEETIFKDVKEMRTDLSEVSSTLENLAKKLQSQNLPISSNAVNNPQNEAILLETLMILREISQPIKVDSAQKKMLAIGVTPYSILDK